MQKLAEISVKRPIFAAVLVLALIALGIFAIPNLGIERYPNVDIPYVIVTTTVPGASAAEIETDVTEIIEGQVNTISGIDTLTSTSYDGYSQVLLQFKLEKDGNTAAQEVRAAVDQVLPDLPKEAEKPVVSRERTDDIPIVSFTISAPNVGLRELTEYTKRRLFPQLQGLSGVGGLTIVGGTPRQIHIETDADRLAAVGLTVADVQRAVETHNSPVPGGTIDRDTKKIALRTQGRVQSLSELSEIAVQKQGGRLIRLRDIADITDGEAQAVTLARVNGKPTVLINVLKQSGANSVAVAQSLQERLAEIAPTLPPGYKTSIVRDESVFVRAAVNDVQTHLVLGSILAAGVVLIFLKDWRSTLIAAIAIPSSIIATFALMWGQGFSLNVLTLLALTLAVGIVIDDAILVLENIVRVMTVKQLDPVAATRKATREISLAVLATTLSLVAVFAPVALIPGLVGRFLKSFGLTMAAAILVSLFVAFTVTPMLSSRWLRRPDASGQTEHPHTNDWLTPIENAYAHLLQSAVKPGRRWITVLLALLSIGATVPLGIVANKGFLPQDDQSQFQITVRTKEGTSLQETARVLETVAAEVRTLPDVQETLVTAGEVAANRGVILVRMPSKDERKYKTTQGVLQDKVATDILAKKFPDLDALATSSDPFTGGSAAIQYVLTGTDRGTLIRLAEKWTAELRTKPDVAYAQTTAYGNAPEVQATLNRERCADLGVTPADVALTLRTLSAGEKIGRFAENGRTYDILLRATPTVRTDAQHFTFFLVPATEAAGGTVPVSQVITLRSGAGVSEIARYARQNEVRILVQPKPGANTDGVQEQLQTIINRDKLPEDVRGFWEGDSKEMEKTFAGFFAVLLLSIVFMYLILAAQFESWIHPITILISLPLCVPFALLPIVLTGDSVNLFSLLGVLVLFGIVKKNAILQIDHANQLRREGQEREAAIVQSSRDRLRPILMTTIAFVAGMIPLAFSHEAGAETNRSISVPIIGGQLLSLALTLVAIPVFYSVFDDLTKLIGKGRGISVKTAAVALLLCLLPGGAQAEEPIVIRSVDDAVALALRLNPETRIANLRRERSRLGTKALRAQLLAPQIFTTFTYTRLSNANALGGASSTGSTNASLPSTGGSLIANPPGDATTRSRQTTTDPIEGDLSVLTDSPVDLNITTGQIGVSLPIDITGTLHTGVQASRLDEQIAALDADRTAQDIALNVRVAAYELLRAEAIARVRDAALTRSEEQTRLTIEREKEGLVSEFDRLRTVAEEKKVRQDSVAAHTNQKTARIVLAQRIGVSLTAIAVALSDTEPVPEVDETDIEKLFLQAIVQRPEIAVAHTTETRSRLATRFARRDGEPSLSVAVAGLYNGNQAGFGIGGSSTRGTGTVSATLTVPLYDGGAVRASVQSAQSEQKEAAFRTEQYRTQIRAEIEAAVILLNDARTRQQLADSASIDAQNAEQIAQIRFTAGIGTRLELLDAQVARTDAEVNATSAGYDVRIARAKLARTIGG